MDIKELNDKIMEARMWDINSWFHPRVQVTVIRLAFFAWFLTWGDPGILQAIIERI